MTAPRLWSYLEKFGRPHKRDEPGVEKDAVEMPPTQIGRALGGLGIVCVAAHSPQAKGRVERSFKTAQDRVVKGMRVAGVKTIEQANEYLLTDYLVWWERESTVKPRHPTTRIGRWIRATTWRHCEPRGNAAGTEQLHATVRGANCTRSSDPAIVTGLRGANVR